MDKQHGFDIAYIKLTAQLATVLRYSYRFVPGHQMLHLDIPTKVRQCSAGQAATIWYQTFIGIKKGNTILLVFP